MVVEIDKNEQTGGVDPHRIEATYRFRFCVQCAEIKPPRAHHCQICGKCVMRMDHHCPWVGSCVGLLNHKHFWLFLFYSATGLLLIAAFLAFSHLEIGYAEFWLPMHLALSIGVGVHLLLISHTIFILKNWTSIECGYLFFNDIYRE
mmetsp:Transcript_6734/g.9199  ORF Transcript_6734/g.9199 Transcript_6734/m.9199 type:complete len:147 (+) Transcript_6734:477-917(+)